MALNLRSLRDAFWRPTGEDAGSLSRGVFELRRELADAVSRPITQPLEVDGYVSGRSFVEARGAVGAKLAPWITGHPVYPKQTYRGVIQHGYYNNELIYSGLNLLVKTFAQAYMEVQDDKEQTVAAHPLARLVKAPNPEDDEYSFWEWTLLDMYLTGNAIWEKVRNVHGEVVEIWRLEPERVAVFPDPLRIVSHYLYEVGGVWYRIPRRNILHWRFFNPGPDPLDRYFGLSPIIAAWRSLMTDNEMTDFTKVTLQNLAVPAIVIEAQQKVDDGFAQRFRQTWKERYGKANRGDVAILQQGMTAKALGMNMEQLSFTVLREIMETRVLMTIGGAPLLYLLGTHAGMQRAIYNNYSEARDALAEDVIGPLWARFGSTMTRFMLPEFDKSGRLRAFFNTSRVIAIEERRMDRIEKAVQATVSGTLTRDEGRSLAGYAALGKGKQDELYVPITVNRVQVEDGEIEALPEPTPDESDDGTDFGKGGATGSSGGTAQTDDQEDEEVADNTGGEGQDLELPTDQGRKAKKPAKESETEE